MSFPRFMALATVLLASLGVAAAQPAQRCQIVSIEVPETIEEGSTIVISAKLSTVVPTARPEFKWQINTGTIIAGEGTSSITVDTTGLGGQLIEATVSVSGISTVCLTAATGSVSVRETGPTCGLPLDQYGDIRFEDEKARLDNFAIQLFNDKGATGYILVYAGKQTYESEAAERLLRAKNYLVRVRKMDPARIFIIDGGYRQEYSVTLIIAPPGADPPSTMPDLSPAEIQLTKSRPREPAKRKASRRQ
jgi:hypothetical protein